MYVYEVSVFNKKWKQNRYIFFYKKKQIKIRIDLSKQNHFDIFYLTLLFIFSLSRTNIYVFMCPRTPPQRSRSI